MKQSLKDELKVALAPSFYKSEEEMLVEPTVLKRNVTAMTQLEYEGKNIMFVGFDNGDVVKYWKDEDGLSKSQGWQVNGEPILSISSVDFSVSKVDVEEDWNWLPGTIDESMTVFIYTRSMALTYDLQTGQSMVMDGIEDSVIGMTIIKTYSVAEIFVCTKNLLYQYSIEERNLQDRILPSKSFSFGRMTINRIEHYADRIFLAATTTGEMIKISIETNGLQMEPVNCDEPTETDEIVAVIKKRY